MHKNQIERPKACLEASQIIRNLSSKKLVIGIEILRHTCKIQKTLNQKESNMYTKLLLGLVLSAFLASGLSAQSSSKGHKSRSSSAAMKKQERMDAREKLKLVGQIQREDFAGLKLNKDQRNKLKSPVDANFVGLTKIDMQIGDMIPGAKRNKLKKNYLMAKKEGMSNAESMKKSMMKVGISEAVTMKVMKLNESKDELMDQIRAGVTEMLTDEQKKMKMEMMADEAKDDDGEQIGEPSV